jgi:hypothetical protein
MLSGLAACVAGIAYETPYFIILMTKSLRTLHDRSHKAVEDRIKNDPLLALRGSGKELWADEHADEYVRRLREDEKDSDIQTPATPKVGQ